MIRNKGQGARRAPGVLLMAVCLGLTGCSTFGKKQPSPAAPASRVPAEPRPDLPDRSGVAQAPAPTTLPSQAGAILAGQVIDRANPRPPSTIIQVCEASSSPVGPPQEVSADSQGYFTIRQGLQPGKHYQLTARAQDGSRHLIGTVFATPPDARVVIPLGDDSSGTPAPTPPLAGAGAGGTAVPPGPRGPDQPADQDWAPGRSGLPDTSRGPLSVPSNAPRRAAELGAPIGIYGTPAPPAVAAPAPQTVVRPQDIAEGGPVAQLHRDPLIKVPGPYDLPPSLPPNPPRGNLFGPGPLPARVPSCDLTGNTLYNFALNDLNGQPWEFQQHRGRLVLLDFWGTWCGYCVQAIPHLVDLQRRYGPYGLQVVGIAYEHGDPRRQIDKINVVRRNRGINYQLLLGSSDPESFCPVKNQFQVMNFPTLVLLDDQGRILWRTEGLSQAKGRELEIIIGQRLGVR